MPASERRITRDDILPLETYTRDRRARRQELMALKKKRRVAVGPFATFHFESYETMWHQIHEMLLIEKGGEAQIPDELAAYNPLIPQGRELVVTMMLEIEDPARRARELARLGGIETAIVLTVGGETVRAVPEADVERTREDGKTSSVHFLHFPFTDRQIEAFRAPGTPVTLGIQHPEYGHIAVLPDAVRAELARDFA